MGLENIPLKDSPALYAEAMVFFNLMEKVLDVVSAKGAENVRMVIFHVPIATGMAWSRKQYNEKTKRAQGAAHIR